MSVKAENGASIIRAGDFLDPTAIPATISLPAAVWERLTADLRDDDREGFGRPELPDTPLHARIELFLEMLAVGWEFEDTLPLSAAGHDLDDDMPF